MVKLAELRRRQKLAKMPPKERIEFLKAEKAKKLEKGARKHKIIAGYKKKKKRKKPSVRKAPTERQIDYAISLIQRSSASRGFYEGPLGLMRKPTKSQLRKMSRYEVSGIIEGLKD